MPNVQYAGKQTNYSISGKVEMYGDSKAEIITITRINVNKDVSGALWS